jgi:hypothetical protein
MNELTHAQVPGVKQEPVSAPRPTTASTQSAKPVAATADTGLTLVNTTSTSAEFRICQGSNQIAKVSVAPGANARMPMGNAYSVSATTMIGDLALTTATVSFKAHSAFLIARVKLSAPGIYGFELLRIGATQPWAIVLENTWRAPVTFNITRNDSPIDIVTVVDAYEEMPVSTAPQWKIYAIVNGMTTMAVQTIDPDATISVSQDTDDDSYILTVS